MSINHVANKDNENKLNLFCNKIECEQGIYDKTAWVAQVSEADNVAKDFLDGWTNINVGTLRSNIGTFEVRRSRLLNAPTECSVFRNKGEFTTTVNAGVLWQFVAPTYYNETLAAQTFVLSSLIATDSSTNTDYRGSISPLGGNPDQVLFSWNNLTPAIGATIRVRYEYTLSQEVPYVE
jgi:hypothetical protein